MRTLLEDIDTVAWDRLFHAYGPATDTPLHLRALLSADEKARKGALAHLWSAEIHQGTPWLSTPHTALLVARIVDEAGLPSSERANLLDFLRAVAQAGDLGDQADEVRATAFPEDGGASDAWLDEYLAAGEDEQADLWTDGQDAGEAVATRGIVGCYDAMPRLLGHVRPHLQDPDPEVRTSAAGAIGILARHPDNAAAHAGLVAELTAAARGAGPDERAALVLSMGELGGAPREFLADPWLGVRGCAALAPALAGDPEALEVLRKLIGSPRAFDHAFGVRPPQFEWLPRWQLIATACERIADPEDLASGAVAVVPCATRLGWRSDLGPFLRRIFPDGWPAMEDRTRAQRLVARMLAARDEQWEAHDGNRGACFVPLGLPDDRDAWRELAADRTGPGEYSAEDVIVLGLVEAVHARPAMYFGATREDPKLPSKIVEALGATCRDAVERGEIRGFTLDAGCGLDFVLDIDGAVLPQCQFEATTTVCSTVTTISYADGRAGEQRFAHGLALGPVTDRGPAERVGFHIVLELDGVWLPVGASLG